MRRNLTSMQRAGGERTRAKLAGKKVMIWSAEHGAWWRPNRCGYTTEASHAGIYEFADAWRATFGCGPEKRIVFEVVQDPPPRPGDAWTPGKSDEALLEDAVRCAKPRQTRGWQPRWVAVKDTFALGSGYSQALCRRFGFDPDEKVRR